MNLTLDPGRSDPRTARTVGELLARRAGLHPDRPAFVPLGRDGANDPIPFGALHDRAHAVAAALQARARPGERVLLVFPNEPAFLDLFLGCLLAGIVAVPVNVPRNSRGMERLLTIAQTAGVRFAVSGHGLQARLARMGGEAAPFDWYDPDTFTCGDVDAFRAPKVSGQDVAVLQFTSGSTGAPKAVMVRHANILHNTAMLQSVCGEGEDMRMVSWLPFFHDWGLFGCVLFPIFTGGLSHFMDPSDFLRRPLFWIESIAATRSRVSCAPDFAYAQAAREAENADLSGLDLSQWRLAMMGAEPIRADTMAKFTQKFAPAGFRETAFFPSYGLAESTLIVSGGDPAAPPVIRDYDRASLQSSHARAASDAQSAQRLVGVGAGLLEQRVAIVDTETGFPRPEGSIGEIWVSGPSVTGGYLDRAEETEDAFEARLPGDPANWLRTGDLGFVDDGELFVCGRLKDVIIKAGVNYFAEDIEHSALAAHPALRANTGAAIGVDTAGGERLVVLCELDYGPRPNLLDPVVGAIQKRIKTDHDVFADAIALLKPGTLEKTSSGKIRRQNTAALFADGKLDPLKLWQNW